MLLHALVVLVIHRAGIARGAVDLGEDVVVILDGGAVDTLLEDRLRFVELELGLKVVEVVRVTIGTAMGVDEIELLVDYLLAHITPIALTGTILLRLLGIDALEAVLGEEFGNVVVRKDGAFGKTSVILIIELVGSSHIGVLRTCKFRKGDGSGDEYQRSRSTLWLMVIRGMGWVEMDYNGLVGRRRA